MTTGSKPEHAVLTAVSRGGFDLIIMGVLFRPTAQRLYFGPKVENILRDARCGVALVAFPERHLRA
jgi:nucleotide-binding universal stress UspA family protein